MTLTPYNYLENHCQIPVSTLPSPLKKGHTLALKAFDKNALAYTSNAIVKSSMDHYLKAINEFMGAHEAKLTVKKSVKSVAKTKKQTSHSSQTKKENSNSKPHRASAKATKNHSLSSRVKQVERVPEEIRFLRRYVNMHGKVKTRLSVLQLLSSLQKAMIEKRIRKTSPYAQEILQMQDQLIGAANRMGSSAEISITKTNLKHYLEITNSQRIRESIALLKRFVNIHGREGVQESATRLIAAMERMVKKGKVKKSDPYAVHLNNAYKALKIYIRDKSKSSKIQASELSGMYGLLGISSKRNKWKSPAKSKGLSGVMSSTELVRMDFETIGLKGKFCELIGDPSVGFTAMVFGQPKSGKSTLMLEFAHYLSIHHGEVLYVAFEEGYGYTLKEKITRIGAVHPRLNFSESLPKDVSSYDFVFIDSVSRAGMELEDLVKLKNSFPQTSFLFIFHATKEGKFRGGNELAHEVDVIIEVENGLAKGKGRFGQGEIGVRF